MKRPRRCTTIDHLCYWLWDHGMFWCFGLMGAGFGLAHTSAPKWFWLPFVWAIFGVPVIYAVCPIHAFCRDELTALGGKLWQIAMRKDEDLPPSEEELEQAREILRREHEYRRREGEPPVRKVG